jgi:hypothetical protein
MVLPVNVAQKHGMAESYEEALRLIVNESDVSKKEEEQQ